MTRARAVSAFSRAPLPETPGRIRTQTLNLQDQRAAAVPKSPLGAAIGYALRN
jgi:hypothetical protein